MVTASPARRIASLLTCASLVLGVAAPALAARKAAVPKATDLSAVQSILQNADFLVACEKGDAAEVRKLLKEGANPNAARSSGATALSYAVAGRHLEVVHVLLAAKADPNRDSFGMAPLFLAAETGDLGIVKALLGAGAKVNARLHAVDEEMKVREGDTALIASASPTGKGAVTRALLAAGADVNARADNGKTAVIQAAAAENLDVLKALLEAKPDVKARMSAPEEIDALMIAVGKNRADMVQLLIAAGADVGVKLDGEVTMLEFAILSEERDVAAVLRKAGAEEPSPQRLAALRKAASEQ